jgi:hypothetical protein
MTQVAVSCARNRFRSVIIPLLNYSAYILGLRVLLSIRADGGWAGFTVPFRPESTASWRNVPMTFATGGIFVSLVSVICSLFMR